MMRCLLLICALFGTLNTVVPSSAKNAQERRLLKDLIEILQEVDTENSLNAETKSEQIQSKRQSEELKRKELNEIIGNLTDDELDIMFDNASSYATDYIKRNHELDLLALEIGSDTLASCEIRAEVSMSYEHHASEKDKEEGNEAIFAWKAIEYFVDIGIPQFASDRFPNYADKTVNVKHLFRNRVFRKYWKKELSSNHHKGKCPEYKEENGYKRKEYRTITGECNNVKNREWGAAGTVQERLLDPAYGDGILSPRTQGVNGDPLPSARSLSIKVLFDSSDTNDTPDHTKNTVLIVQWGQGLDHDITETPAKSGYNGAGIDCCHKDLTEAKRNDRFQCFTIEVPSDDPIFGPENRTCMNFVRSIPELVREKPGHVSHVNEITAYIDASQVYGSEERLAKELRSCDGKLAVAVVNNVEYLPGDLESKCAEKTFEEQLCFKAGDFRANENPHLTVFHTLFVKMHNSFAEKLKNMNPYWSGETIYQEARKIVGAVMQKVTYDEWLPKVIGESLMTKHNLSSHFDYTYNPKENAQMTLAFSTAAMRFGHDMVKSPIKRINEQYEEEDSINFEDTFFDTYFTHGGLEDIMRWAGSEAGKKNDGFLIDALQNKLFGNLDLYALNIQRGRDHGVPPYVDYRDFCGLDVPNSWSDLKKYIPGDAVDAMENLYGSVQDIDLFVGGILEYPAEEGANVGETFGCLLGKQFHALKYGDRFFYQNTADDATKFSEDQLKALEKIKFAGLYCDVMGIDELTEDPFELESDSNPRKTCDELDEFKLDLTAWEDNGGYYSYYYKKKEL